MAQYDLRDNQMSPRNNDVFDVVMLADQDGNIINSASAAANINIAIGALDGYSFEHVNGAVPSMSQNKSGSIWDVSDINYPFQVFGTGSVLTITVGNNELNHELIIEGFNELGEHTTETIQLTTNTVTTTNQFLRVHSATYSAGSSFTNVEDILISVGSPVELITDPGFNIVAKILAGRGRTSMGIFSVPKGFTAFITHGVATCGANADATIDMFIKYDSQTNYVIRHSFEISGTGGQYDYTFTVPIALPEYSDIDVRAQVRTNNARITCAYDIILVQNDVL